MKLPPIGYYTRIKDNIEMEVIRHSADNKTVWVKKLYDKSFSAWPVTVKNFWSYYKEKD